MQFIANGPDVPDALLQAHEEGRVVFFCGAGISYPAGLPGFKGLVDAIYDSCGTSREDIESDPYDLGRYDATLDLLERRLPGRRIEVRQALAGALKPKLRRKGATETHAALLRLARDRKGSLRLVTTNFDRVFEVAGKRSRQSFQTYAAPTLPIPKNSRWDGLVYLHGKLPENGDVAALNRLVVTSGDFGLAYLTERWAARFVSELFRNYVVCFVGYSINDPVLRYMMDALAADRMLGEVTPQAWALGDCAPGDEAKKTVEWEAKGVTPILYTVPTNTNDHSTLHKTLQVWAETYRDGVTGKERIVVAHALARPSASTKQDDFVGRMLWALADPIGLPARTFADFNPVPPLDWLFDAFATDRYGHADLSRFGVPPHQGPDQSLRFGLIHRPAPYHLAPPMRLVTGGFAAARWDDLMFELARWLVRHLNDPRLIVWVAERGGQLHESWIWQIENRLDEIARLERDGKTSDLNEMRSQAPNAIPTPPIRTLWRLLLSGRVKSPWRQSDLFRWRSRVKRDGLTSTLRFNIRELLSPMIRLSKPFHLGDESDTPDEPMRPRQVVDLELVLAADHVRAALEDLTKEPWLPDLLEDFERLLRDALDLLHEIGDADQRFDRSNWDLPSICPHWQNRGFRDWVALIELLRDSWLAVHAFDRTRASQIACRWFELPYSTFKRLALFAATQEECASSDEWTKWLISDGAWWLWASETKREVLRLLVLQGYRLSRNSQDLLEEAILAGPPRAMYPADVETDQWNEIVSESIWLRLAKLSSSGAQLGAVGRSRLEALSSSHPTRQLAENQSDEFSSWMTGTGDPDWEENRDVDVAPRTRREILAWLVNLKSPRQFFHEDTWRDVCRTRFFHSFFALCDLAGQHSWPTTRWREALQVWSEDEMVLRSWRWALPVVQAMPDHVLQELVHSVTWWIQAASTKTDQHKSLLLGMCLRILNLSLDENSGIRRSNGESIDQPVTEAINHPIGHVTQALISLWFKQEPSDDDGLPVELRELFSLLCDAEVQRFRHGRVILASRLIALFRVDRAWTEYNLFPRFDWSIDPAEAKAAWEGFLWSPRLYLPLLVALKRQLLETSRHYDDLGQHGRQFAAFMTYAALGQVESYSTEDWRAAFASLPNEGLRESAQAMAQSLEGASDQREEYWKNRILPLWKGIWPKSRELATPAVSAPLARLCIAAGSDFPVALAAVTGWLQPIEHPYSTIKRLKDSGHCERFPSHALRLLASTIADPSWDARELGQCLELIIHADKSLASDPCYQRLLNQVRKQAR